MKINNFNKKKIKINNFNTNELENSNKNKKDRKGLAKYSEIIIIVFILAFLSILFNNYIYEKNDNLINLKNEIETVKKENDNLSLQISKKESIENIIEAINKNTQMIYPNNDNIFFIDENIEYFPHLKK